MSELFILFIILGSNLLIYAKNVPQVAFECGRPTLYRLNNRWMHDFNQKCLYEDQEDEIVKYCKKRYPKYNIVNAEPSPVKVKIDHWCDLKSDNCYYGREVTTYVCLDIEFQSDALTLNHDCEFGHVTDKNKCLDYRELRKIAYEKCETKQKVVDSIGMTFPCKELPMHFYGVEFVCCPKTQNGTKSPEPGNFPREMFNQSPAIKNIEEEQSNFESQRKKLIVSEKQILEDQIRKYQKEQQRIDQLKKIEPKEASKELQDLKNKFVTLYNGYMEQFRQNDVQLLLLHNNRLKFMFNTRMAVLQNQLKVAVQRNNETESIEILKEILNVILTRRKDLDREIKLAKENTLNIVDDLKREKEELAFHVSKVMSILDGNDMKSHVMKEINQYVPVVGKHRLRRYHRYYDLFKNLDNILASSPPHHSHTHENEDSSNVHYDLGLNDPDQVGHGHHHRHHMMNRHNYSMALILMGIVILLFLFASIILFYRYRRIISFTGGSGGNYATVGRSPWQRLSTNSYDNDLKIPKANSVVNGFGVDSRMCKATGDNIRVVENPTYKLISNNKNDDDLAGIHSNEALIK